MPAGVAVIYITPLTVNSGLRHLYHKPPAQTLRVAEVYKSESHPLYPCYSREDWRAKNSTSGFIKLRCIWSREDWDNAIIQLHTTRAAPGRGLKSNIPSFSEAPDFASD